MFEFYDPFIGWAPVRSMDDERLLKNTYIPACESKEEEKMDISKMTKEDALKAIDNLKAYVEQCEKKEKEIPKMPFDKNDTSSLRLVLPAYGSWQDGGVFQFKSINTCAHYKIKAFELAHLMYAREHLEFKYPYSCKYSLYFDSTSNKLEYDVISFDERYSSNGIYRSINLWLFPDEDSARRVCTYMNKYVKDTVKEIY